MAVNSKKKIFEKAYIAYAQTVFRYLYYKCGDAALSEDLMQDSFVRYWKHCDKLEASKEKAYLLTVAKNLLINHKAHKNVVFKFEQRKSSRMDSNTPHHELEKKEFQNQLNEAIASLSHGQREVFLLNRLEGMKYREIAEMLGLSQKAVEKRMSQALQKLRKIYNKI